MFDRIRTMVRRISHARLRHGRRRRARSRAVEQLESRHLLATNLIISEFQAVNNSTLADEDGDFSDWFEIRNPIASDINLNGWHVTDDAVNLTKWQFPDVTIPAGGQLLVFASNKDRLVGELHSNFRLLGSGEYLALVEPDGMSVAFEYAPQYPPQLADVSYGASLDGTTVGFFPSPTPGAANMFEPVADATRQIVITEIMYHPASENLLEEFIEISNQGQVAVDLSGWSFTSGIDFLFPSVTLSAGDYLVIAADVSTFMAKYPDVTNVIGGWQGRLSNRGERIGLVDDLGVTIDTLTYADEGDWAIRAEGLSDQGQRGWVWQSEHDGGGVSLELVNDHVSNDFGQNWTASILDAGTPGRVNSVAVADSAPLILDVMHSPAIPKSTDPVTITARIVDQTVRDISARLYWRGDNTSGFRPLTMHDDGQHGDQAAGDFIFGVTIPPQPDGTVVEFYVHASDPMNNVRIWPAPVQKEAAGQVIPLIEDGALARALVPTDDFFDITWTGADELFDDSTWTSGTTGIGYDTGPIGESLPLPISYWKFDELAVDGSIAPDEMGQYDGAISGATLTSGGRGRFGEALSFDGDNDSVTVGVVSELTGPSAFSIALWFLRTADHAGSANETNHTVNNVLIAQSSNAANDNLEIGTEGDDVEVYLDTVEFGGQIPSISQSASVQNDIWHHLVLSYDSSEPKELNLYVDGLLVSEYSDYGGLVSSSGTSPFTIGLARPGQDEWGDFEGLIDDVVIWNVGLDAAHAAALFAGTSPVVVSGYTELIGLDVQSGLFNQNTSAYIRIPFTVDDPSPPEVLTLRVRYDDAFVAYLNGTEVARSGATGIVAWNSAADVDRPDGDALQWEEFPITHLFGLLEQGPNLLAIQVLNHSSDAPRLLVIPELTVVRGAYEANALYQVLDGLDPASRDRGSPSVYHQIMTPAERGRFIGMSRSSNAQMNATFIAVTDTDVEVRYNTGVRYRGSGSRGGNPPGNRINIPSDRTWQGLTELNINAGGVANQIAGSALYRLAGLAAPVARPVLMYSNGQNLKDGVYAHSEPLNTNFAEKHFPSDNGGNLYKGRRPDESPPGGQGAGLVYLGTNPESYASYLKSTNKGEQDWSDVINLTHQLNQTPSATFIEDVGEVVNIDQWLRFFALSVMIDYHENSLLTGDKLGDDYGMYRGVIDPRFQMVAWDLDSLLRAHTTGLLPFANVPALNRLVNHPDVFPRYGAQLWDMANKVLTREAVSATLDAALPAFIAGDVSAQSFISETLLFLDNRRNWVNDQLVAPVSLDPSGGHVVAGSQVTLSAPTGTIYYTTDASDPRLPSGMINPLAIEYIGQPVVINATTRIVARAYNSDGAVTGFPMRWSGKSVSDFVAGPELVVSEINYNPHNAQPGEIITNNDDFEFVELMNVGVDPFDLNGVQFVRVNVKGDEQGIEFAFGPQTLGPGKRIVVVNDRAAFQSRYGNDVTIASGIVGDPGEYLGSLSNAGERLTLVNASGITIVQLDYDDQGDWPERADGFGSSLERIDSNGMPNGPMAWQASREIGGTPTTAGDSQPTTIVVNEVFSNSPGPLDDMIEFYNPSSMAIDISGMWLSDSLDSLDRYVIPAGTLVPAKGYLVLDENQFRFGLNGDEGDRVMLVQPGTAGYPDQFVAHVSFGPSLPGESIGRWPNAVGVLVPMSSTTFGADNSGPRIGPVVISEIMYTPPESAQAFDPQRLGFVEIYNPSPVTVDLSGWELGGIGYQFANGTMIGPGRCFVLVPFYPDGEASRVTAFENAYRVDIAANLSSYLGPYPGRLLEGGEPLTLRRAVPRSGDPTTFQLVSEDQVIYSNTDPWPTEANGSGASLQRLRVDLWGNDATSWIDGTPNPGRLGRTTFATDHDSTAAAVVIGEVGQVSNMTHQVQTVTLSKAYVDPVIFAQPASFNGSDPVVVRISNIQTDQFDLVLVEPSNLNGMHGVGESVSYVVLERGSHWLADGTHIEVGTIETSATVGRQLMSRTWETVNFPHKFVETPVVLSQPQTAIGAAYLSTRQNLITPTSFDVALEQEEKITTQHVTETVGYLAMDPGIGTWNGMKYEAELTSLFFLGSFFFTEKFDQLYTTPPNFLASLSSYANDDNAHLRLKAHNAIHVSLKVEEDTTYDAEVSHRSESAAYLAIEGAGALTAIPAPLSDGQTTTFRIAINDTGEINDLNVALKLVHTRTEDLDVFLEAPDGTTVELLTDVVGEGNSLTVTTLDDEALQSIAFASVPFTGTFQPEGRLGDFAGKEISGNWTLHVTDDTANGDGGALVEWSLVIDLAPQPEGNLNYDGRLDAADIDLLFSNLGSADPTYDLESDGDADQSDVDHLVLNVLGTRMGDTDLDNDVDINDFKVVENHLDFLGELPFHGWSQGNFDGDRDVDITDVLRLVVNFAPLGNMSSSRELLAATSVSANLRPDAGVLSILPKLGETRELGASHFSQDDQRHTDRQLPARPGSIDVRETTLSVDNVLTFSNNHTDRGRPKSRTSKFRLRLGASDRMVLHKSENAAEINNETDK